MEQNFNDYIIDGRSSVSQALRRLELNYYKILFVAAEDCVLRGVVTDGNIRRFLLGGGDVSAPVIKAANTDPVKVEGYHEGRARDIVRQREISCVPMVDASGRIHALVFKDRTVHRVRKLIDTPVIMMAGGFGTRLRPYTEILPKPLIPVGGVTITEQILRRFRKFGCSRFSLVVNYKRNLIKSYFSEVDSGRGLEFVDEDEPLGTGGGLAFFKGRYKTPVFVTNCDSVVEADYADILNFHIKTGSIVTMVCCKKAVEIPYGVVDCAEDGRVTALREKPSYELLMNTGFYVVSPEFIELIPNNRYTPITEVIDYCREMGKRVSAYTIEDECFIDIGQLDDLKSVEDKLL